MTHPALRSLLLLAAAWLAAVFDCGVAPWLELRHCAPSACLLAAAVSIALSRSSYAFLTAGWFGLVADVSGAGPLGPALGCFACVGFLLIAIRRPGSVSDRSSPLSGTLRQFVELLLGTLAMSISLTVVQGLSSATDVAWAPHLKQSVGAGLYTVALALPILLLAATTRPAFPSPAPVP